MNIYISHYISNESLSAFFISLALFFTLQILNKKTPSQGSFLLLGVVLGLSLLTKITVLAILPVICLVLFYTLVGEQRYTLKKTVKAFGGIFFFLFFIAGWFYIRNYMVFGNPVVTNWSNPTSGFAWWQDPGYYTYKYYLQFGKVFSFPYFAGSYSFLDSLYSTFWGDGLFGGTTVYESRPVWNYDYMSTVYLIAAPMFLPFLIGFYHMMKSLLIDWNKNWFLLLGSIAAIAFGMIAMSLKMPFYSAAKSFYALPLMIPLSLIGGWGVAVVDEWCVDRKIVMIRTCLYGWLGTLAMSIFFTFRAQ